MKREWTIDGRRDRQLERKKKQQQQQQQQGERPPRARRAGHRAAPRPDELRADFRERRKVLRALLLAEGSADLIADVIGPDWATQVRHVLAEEGLRAPAASELRRVANQDVPLADGLDAAASGTQCSMDLLRAAVREKEERGGAVFGADFDPRVAQAMTGVDYEMLLCGMDAHLDAEPVAGAAAHRSTHRSTHRSR